MSKKHPHFAKADVSFHFDPDFVDVRLGDGPIVAVAVHDGHEVRDEVAARMSISAADRLREEDAWTGYWTAIAPTQIVGRRSRFEVDLNRPREQAVYRMPEDAWGLEVWREPPSEEILERSLKLYDAFYQSLEGLLTEKIRRYGWCFVYDLHSYNHRRGGPEAPPSHVTWNPQINPCTGGMDLERCEPLVQCFEETIRRFAFPGGTLDVRRNVRFQATRFSRWVHDTFPGRGISLAVEVKKIYVDEWTGRVDESLRDALGAALQSTVPAVTEAAERVMTRSIL